LARAPEPADDTERTKAELQRRMEEARESITQTVSEIKDTVVNQYQQVRETINDTLDWREQYRRRPLPFSIGAFVGGALVGYVVMGALKGGGSDYDEETDAAFDRIEGGFDQMGTQGGISPGRTYAAAPILGGAAASAYQRTSRPESNASTEAAEVFGEGQASYESVPDVGPSTRPSYSSGYQAQTAPATQGPQGLVSSSSASGADSSADEPKGPGIIQRFKETKAYDKLQDELSTLGERFIEELSQTARTVVVPALLGKLKDLVGVDLSGRGSQQAGGGQSAHSNPLYQGAGQSGTNPLNQRQSAASAPEQSRSATAGQGTGQGTTGGAGSTGTAGTTGGTEGYGAS